MPDSTDAKLALFELYLETAEKVTDRRAQANSWMLSVNSAIVALYGYLQGDNPAFDATGKAAWLWAIPAAGAIVCVAWTVLLQSYRQLNRAKFAVLMEIEADLAAAPFRREREIYRAARRLPLSNIEICIPACFVLLYAVMILAAFFRSGS